MNINQKHKLTLVISIAIVIGLTSTIIFLNHDKLFKPLVDKTVMVKKEEIIPAKQVTVLERKIVPYEAESFHARPGGKKKKIRHLFLCCKT